LSATAYPNLLAPLDLGFTTLPNRVPHGLIAAARIALPIWLAPARLPLHDLAGRRWSPATR